LVFYSSSLLFFSIYISYLTCLPFITYISLLQSRGFVGRNEMYRKFQGDCLPGGYDHFNWVIFDEVHAIDGEDGDALQRLIRAMSCKFLALSATVGNAQELRGWLERVRGDQLLGKHFTTGHDTTLHYATPYHYSVHDLLLHSLSSTSLCTYLPLFLSLYPSPHLHSSPLLLSFSVFSFYLPIFLSSYLHINLTSYISMTVSVLGVECIDARTHTHTHTHAI
jgi:hypothetical protein